MLDSSDERDDFDAEDIDEEGDPQDGEQVFTAWFDCDGIGSGSQDVYLYRGKYYFITEEYRSEAMDTLEDAILAGAGEISSSCSSIECASMKPERLVRLLQVHDDSASLVINGDEWTYDKKSGWRGPEGRSASRQQRRRNP